MLIHEHGFWIKETPQEVLPYEDDHSLALALCEFFKYELIDIPKSLDRYPIGRLTVADFGCGNGFYVKAINSFAEKNKQTLAGRQLPAHGYEGTKYPSASLGLGPGKLDPIFQYDLAISKYLPCYSWVICLNVLQYIPAQYEFTALHNIYTSFNKGLIISWADRDEETEENLSKGYVNCRNQSEVIDLFKGMLGYQLLEEHTSELREAVSVNSSLKRNLLVFRR